MRNYLLLVTVLTMLSLNSNVVQAQQTETPSVFGYQVPKTDTSVHHWRPAYLRLGVVGGANAVLNGTEAEGFGGLRAEIGLSNRFSIAADIRNARSEDSLNIVPQFGLSARYVVQQSNRLQTYIGLGWGLGGSGGGRNGDGDKKGRNHIDNDSLKVERVDGNDKIQNFVTAQLGVNYLLARRLILHAEVSYYLPVGGSNLPTPNNGGLMAQVGLAYQLGRKK